MFEHAFYVSYNQHVSLNTTGMYHWVWDLTASCGGVRFWNFDKYWFLWTAIYKLLIICKSDLTDKMKRSFFQAAVMSKLLYECTAWTLIKQLEKKLDGNNTRMLRAILNKSWRQHPARHQLYGHLPPITKIIETRRTRGSDKLIGDVLLWTPTCGRAKAGRPPRTYIQQLSEDTGCSPEDLPEAMNEREKWRERVRVIPAGGTTWWWWWWWFIFRVASTDTGNIVTLFDRAGFLEQNNIFR